jgi:hypothetical protein
MKKRFILVSSSARRLVLTEERESTFMRSQRVLSTLALSLALIGVARADTKVALEYLSGEKTERMTLVLGLGQGRGELPNGLVVLIDREKSLVQVLSPGDRTFWSARLKDALVIPQPDTSGMPMRLTVSARVTLARTELEGSVAEQPTIRQRISGELTMKPGGMGGFPGGGFPGGGQGGGMPQMPRFSMRGEAQTSALGSQAEAALLTDTLLVSLQESLPTPFPFLRPLQTELNKARQAPLMLELTMEGSGLPAEANSSQKPNQAVKLRVVSVEPIPDKDATFFRVPAGFQKVNRPSAVLEMPARR